MELLTCFLTEVMPITLGDRAAHTVDYPAKARFVLARIKLHVEQNYPIDLFARPEAYLVTWVHPSNSKEAVTT